MMNFKLTTNDAFRVFSGLFLPAMSFLVGMNPYEIPLIVNMARLALLILLNVYLFKSLLKKTKQANGTGATGLLIVSVLIPAISFLGAMNGFFILLGLFSCFYNGGVLFLLSLSIASAKNPKTRKELPTIYIGDCNGETDLLKV